MKTYKLQGTARKEEWEKSREQRKKNREQRKEVETGFRVIRNLPVFVLCSLLLRRSNIFENYFFGCGGNQRKGIGSFSITALSS